MLNVFRMIAVLWTLLPTVQGMDARAADLNQALNSISADSLKKHVAFLGNDSLQGRGTGTPGGRLAAEYIARQLAHWQFIPMGDNRSYFQSIPMHGSFPLPSSQMKIHSNTGEVDLRLKDDYLLYKSGAQTYIPRPQQLVFVGYGIIAPEFDYNDYQSLDVDGKIVVFLSGEPPSEDSTYFDGPYPTIYSYPESKQRIAISRGASGSILIPRPVELVHEPWREWIQAFSFEDVTLAYSVTANLSIALNPGAGEILFQNAPFTLRQVCELEKNNSMLSFPLEVSLSFKGEFTEREFFDRNVVGFLEGRMKRPNDSYLILSAHYDHLGIGEPVKGDSIYNGVGDNAIGVSALLELARVFSLLPEKPLHNIIFLFTTGEEKGLLGSNYYIDHPIAPLYKTIANVNIDGLSMFEKFEDVVGVGQEFSTLGDMLNRVAASRGLKVSPLPSQFLAMESFARSDQIAFAKAGIPSILIAEGLHFENSTPQQALERIMHWSETYYHTPGDDLDQYINFEAAQHHCRFLYSFCHALASETLPPQWNSGTPYIMARLRSIAEKR
ncbi:MAG: M28 family peptidase [Candidatus Zhuqueibacterota bacterium]